MFIDEVRVTVESGKGGDGIIAFRREKHVPLGGPSGGDGGRGGSVIFEADEGLSTLYDLRYRRHIRAKAGENGKPKLMRGADGEDVIIKVPIGTVIFEANQNIPLADLVKHKDQSVIARGGAGGRGNAAFASAKNKAPRFQENGEPSQTIELRIELKLLADVGIIGFPSVGKSTLISACSKAKPKIAPYPFTTIVPNLGVVDFPPIPPFVLADMPGIIEGASQGRGLGLEFLKHIERTRVLIHMIDMSPESGRDPYQDYLAINAELEAYKYQLIKRPQIIAANKIDQEGSEERLRDLKHRLPSSLTVIPISAKNRHNIKELIAKTAELLMETPPFPFLIKTNENEVVHYVYEPKEKEILITKEAESLYSVSGKDIETLYKRSNFLTDEAVSRFLLQLSKLGVNEMLRQKGAKSGDIVRVFDDEFEFQD